MRNIRLKYRYDGSLFFGFQRQIDKRTVQGEIEKLLEIVLKEKVNMISSGRTDRGVHALIQVSNFLTSSTIPLDKLQYVLNRSLPQDIDIIEIDEVDMQFNSRFDAGKRGYRYIISWDKDPFKSRYETYINKEVEITKFKNILSPLVGVHDFNNFRMSDCGSKTSIREIYSIDVVPYGDKRVAIDIIGSSFLKSQIRIIIGTALDIYFGLRSSNYIEEMLANPKKDFVKRVAPPNGLYLAMVDYEGGNNGI
ncbi:tRNA pseudouridine(38-40) synthase TruA [uncultured Fusobacterium sp.]|uniref:tRNA pseudouridine(38-40) synthase TruA n=1 Tax=uncultured Fusobacterium sp. TaxID=159267 RepID=UPI0025978AE2|nr:tRNA pseudouridine(38-40) synthase TruA [uncultured Fusobacterium sp.]